MESLSISSKIQLNTKNPSFRQSSTTMFFNIPVSRHEVSKNRANFQSTRISRNRDDEFKCLRQCKALNDQYEHLSNNHGLVNDFGPSNEVLLLSSSFDVPNIDSSRNGSTDIIKPVEHNGNEKTESRPGLYRTPVSAGVQSATRTYGLPRPALAVRNLMEQARFAHLCANMSKMHHRGAGFPFGSLVDFAPDPMGHPLFQLSSLGIHTRNLLKDPRCSLVVQAPGWNELSNARVTIFGDIVPVPDEAEEWVRQNYTAKHKQWENQKWENFSYYRMQNIRDIFFVGGFGTVQWVDVEEYERTQPDKIAVSCSEDMLKELNAIFSNPLKEILSGDREVDDAAIISIDGKGLQIKVRQGAQFKIRRLTFDMENGVETLEEAKRALQQKIGFSFFT